MGNVPIVERPRRAMEAQSHRLNRNLNTYRPISPNPSSPPTPDLEMAFDVSLPLTPNPPTSDMEWGLNTLRPVSPKRCIYRVPKRLMYANEKAYTPRIVSIGPFHHGKKSLAAMEEHKRRLARAYLSRTGKPLEHFINIIKNKEQDLRDYYAEDIGFSSDDFVNIIFVDALFIIAYLVKFLKPDNMSDYIFDRPHMVYDIQDELLLLENQLPFFILGDLFCPDAYPIEQNKDSIVCSMATLTRMYFKQVLYYNKSDTIYRLISNDQIYHFVDLLIQYEVHAGTELHQLNAGEGKSVVKLPTATELHQLNAGEGNSVVKFPTATELHQFGVKFKVREGKRLFDIHFSNGVLEIPKLSIIDSTELVIRNLIAFEQCHYNDNKYISDYATFMSLLVHTCEDVKLLVENGIIENFVGDNSRVAAMIYKLGDGVFWSENFNFSRIVIEINEHCQSPCNKHMANLKQNYFNSPWTIMKFIAASFIIILTFIQTICSVISVVNE